MSKVFSTTLLTASAVGALLILPAGPAQAQSAACGAAVDLINAAIDQSGGNLDPETGKTLSTKLLGINASGSDSDAIVAYAHALVDETIPDMGAATAEFNRACSN